MKETLLTYVIEYPGTNLVKFGQAKYFVDRFAQLKTGSPVIPVVICLFRGAKHERDFHKKFAHLRHHGEFFHFTAEVKHYLLGPEMEPHRMTLEEGHAYSPRIERTAERLRREKREAKALAENL